MPDHCTDTKLSTTQIAVEIIFFLSNSQIQFKISSRRVEMINDPPTLVSFIVIFLFCEQSFDVQPNYYIRKEVL